MSKAYQPLHHKYRPERFDGLIGQEAIAATLKQALTKNRIAPAYLFSGPRGTGKTSSARILARSLNCLNTAGPSCEPCGTCSLCKSISLGTALDVIEIDAASNTGVDNIREIIEKSRFAPVQARWKVYVIDECHMLSTAAFNALLKTLEEPPAQVVFILATTDPQRVIPTILSRCQRFDFRQIPLLALINHLEMIASKEEICIEKNALEIIAKRAQGGLRDAESMLDQLSLLPGKIKIDAVWDLLGGVPEQELLSLASAFGHHDPISILKICRDLTEKGREPIAILQGFASIIRDLIIQSSTNNYPDLYSISKDSQKELSNIADLLNIDELLMWQAQLKGSEYQLRQSMQPRLWLEVLFLGLLSNNIRDKQPIKKVHNQQELTTKENISKLNFNNVLKKDVINTIINEPSQESKNTQGSNKENLIKDNSKENLSEIWQQILASLELPSTRMLLSQQAKLVRLSNTQAEVHVASNWTSMIQSRSQIIEQAITKSLGSSRVLIIKDQTEKSNAINSLLNINSSNPESLKKENNDYSTETNNAKIPDDKKQNDSINISESKAVKNDNQVENLAEFFNGEVIDLD